MERFKELLAELLLSLANSLVKLANKLNEPEFNIFETGESFDTFKEGMISSDFRTRHIAATKLLGWYLNGNGQPVIGDLRTAAHVLLEDFEATDGDISRLVDCWIEQASTTGELKIKAALDEQLIYDRLQTRKPKITRI
jgi:hypothetical protein